MNSFYVFSGKKIKRFIYIFAAALLAAGVVYVERGNITVFSETAPSAIYSVPTEKKLIALTFDISWGEKGPNRSSRCWKRKKWIRPPSSCRHPGAKLIRKL